jgi:AcrR family transcriptional regulator
MRFVYGRDPARRQGRPASQGQPDVAVERGDSDPVGWPNHLQPRSAAKRERLLAAASRLFYVEGINSEGIKRIIKEGRVTLATF